MAGTRIERKIFTLKDFTRLGIFSPLFNNVSPDDPDRETLIQYGQACVVDNLRFLIGDDSQVGQQEPDAVWKGIGKVLEMFEGERVKIGFIFTNKAHGGRRETLPFEGEFTSNFGIAKGIEKPAYLGVRPILEDKDTRLLIYVPSESSFS